MKTWLWSSLSVCVLVALMKGGRESPAAGGRRWSSCTAAQRGGGFRGLSTKKQQISLFFFYNSDNSICCCFDYWTGWMKWWLFKKTVRIMQRKVQNLYCSFVLELKIGEGNININNLKNRLNRQLITQCHEMSIDLYRAFGNDAQLLSHKISLL